MTRTTTGRSRAAAGPIRVGIVGLGRAGWGMHCGELDRRRQTFRIVAGCDVEASRLERIAHRYPGCATYPRLEGMLVDPHVELVSIATRSPDHVPHALAALRAGKMVFLEKPMALTLEGARKLQAASARKPGRLFVRHNRRFEGEFVHLRGLIASGVLGRIHTVQLRRNGFGFRDDWQAIRRCGGGQLLNWGPHIIDHGLQLLGGSAVEVWGDLKRIAARGDAEDHVKIIMKGRDGCVVDLEISGGAALGEPEWLVLGSRGAVSCSGGAVHLRYLDPKFKPDRRRATPATPPMEGGFARVGAPVSPVWIDQTYPCPAECNTDTIWDRLHDSIRLGTAFPITMTQAVEVMKVVSQVRQGTPFDTLPMHKGR